MLPMPSNLTFEQIREIRILPRNRCFYAEFVYRLEPVQVDVDPTRALGIDTGINNWLTCVSNIGTSFIIETEEANTSTASFINGDSLPAFGEKPEGWHSSGKRTKCSLFHTAFNWYINADANAAANIIRKVATTAGLDIAGVSRGL
jgi:transposase